MPRPLNPYAPEYNPTSHAPPSFHHSTNLQTIYHPQYLTIFTYAPLTYFSPNPLFPPAESHHRRLNSTGKLTCISEPRRKKDTATIRNRHRTVPIVEEDEKTTIMIKNIPYDCPRKRLIRMLDSFCSVENEKKEEGGFRCSYDFLYLPIDFSTRRSRGFAFVNFTSSVAVWKFVEAFHNKQWEEWCKKLEIVSAKIQQGKEALVRHFSESMFECETDEYLPVVFTPARDGGGQSSDVTVIGNRRVRHYQYPHPHPHPHPTNN
ncbi:hypothetical protein M569_05736 [Genlisea aurea]|uniref:RRM domain-containing protein n=1 Tax=Genlisea aurea TaxID=192259 RepID=S8E982_9LAMI|nr:hypothetical protein M569_05736 [Genlisea aurea]